VKMELSNAPSGHGADVRTQESKYTGTNPNVT